MHMRTPNSGNEGAAAWEEKFDAGTVDGIAGASDSAAGAVLDAAQEKVYGSEADNQDDDNGWD